MTEKKAMARIDKIEKATNIYTEKCIRTMMYIMILIFIQKEII